MRKIGNELRNATDVMAENQLSKARLMLSMLPFAILFIGAGAHPLVALMAGMGTALPLFLEWERWQAHRRGTAVPQRDDANQGRGASVSMALLLALAVGTQTMIWAKGWNEEIATHFTGMMFAGMMLMILPIGMLIIGYGIVQELRGKKPVQHKIIVPEAVCIGAMGALPLGLLLACMFSVITFPGCDLLGFVLYLAGAIGIGRWAYHRLDELRTVQGQPEDA